MSFAHSPQATPRNRLHAALLGLAFGVLAASAAGSAQAQTSSVEMAAMLGGRIIGAAKACGINAERIRRTSERLGSVIVSNAASPAERDAAKSQFTASQSAGSDEVRSERSLCHGVHVDFSEMEVKLGRAPAAEGDSVAAKRGVPALGALKPDAASATRKQ